MDEDYLISELMSMGLTEDEAQRELEDFGIDMAGNKINTNLDTAHIDSPGFAQVGRPDYEEKMQFERKYLKYRIFNLIGNPPHGSYLKWTANPHDFGTYHDMVFYFDSQNKKHLKYLNQLDELDMDGMEQSIQSNWDAIHSMGQPDDFIEYPHEDNKIFDLLQ